MELFHSIEGWVLDFGPSLWALFFLFVFCIIDGFLPILPSETLIIALGALIVQGNGPNVYLLIITGALGAILGDQLAFAIGHRYNVERSRFLRDGKGQVAVRFARKGLARRGPLYIIAARFIPIGRVAVNLIAGATGYPRHKFIPLTLLSGPIWSTYSAVIGIASGHLFNGHPILSMLVGVAGGIALGALINIVIEKTTSAPSTLEEVFGDEGAPERSNALGEGGALEDDEEVANGDASSNGGALPKDASVSGDEFEKDNALANDAPGEQASENGPSEAGLKTGKADRSGADVRADSDAQRSAGATE